MTEFLNEWKDLIVKFLTLYPLAAVLLGILAIRFYFELNNEQYVFKNRYLNGFIALLFWVICVPIVGLVFRVFAEIWDVVKVLVPWVIELVETIGKAYQKHPFIVIIITILGGAALFVPKKLWPKKLKSKFIRTPLIVVITYLIIFISIPIADFFIPNEKKEESRSLETNSIVNLEISNIDSLLFRLDGLKHTIEIQNQLVDSLQKDLLIKNYKYEHLTQLHNGDFQRLNDTLDDTILGFKYRIELYEQDKCNSAYLSKINYFKNSNRNLSSTKKIDLESKIGAPCDQLVSLKFVQWNSANDFILKVNDSTYTFEIISSKVIHLVDKKTPNK